MVFVVLSAQKSKQSSQKSKLASGPFAFLSGTFTFLSGQFTLLIRTRAKVTPYLSLQPIYGFLEFGRLKLWTPKKQDVQNANIQEEHNHPFKFTQLVCDKSAPVIWKVK